jgi:hypothetical protein
MKLEIRYVATNELVPYARNAKTYFNAANNWSAVSSPACAIA